MGRRGGRTPQRYLWTFDLGLEDRPGRARSRSLRRKAAVLPYPSGWELVLGIRDQGIDRGAPDAAGARSAVARCLPGAALRAFPVHVVPQHSAPATRAHADL